MNPACPRARLQEGLERLEAVLQADCQQSAVPEA